MIAAILSVLLVPAQEVVPELELVEVWSTKVPSTTAVMILEYPEAQLLIDGELINPADGSVEEGPADLVVIAERQRPDLTKEPIGELDDAPYGYVILHRGEEFDYAVRGRVNDEGFIQGTYSRLTLLDKDGNIVKEAAAHTPTQGLFGLRPIRVYPRVDEGFLLLRGDLDYQTGYDVRFDGVVLLDPYEPSPLRVVIYHDLTNPERALGVYFNNFNEYFRQRERYIAQDTPLVCGNIYTGMVYWRLSNEIRWARRVGEHILAFNSVERQFGTVQQEYGNRLRESDGSFTPLDSSVLAGKLPGTGTNVVNGLIVRIVRGEESATVTSYRLEEK